MSAQEAAQRAAVAKYIFDLARDYKAVAEADLKEQLEPGDRKMAAVGDDQVATISMSKVTEKTTFTVTDEQALIRWLFIHEGGEGTEQVLTTWKRNELIARAEDGQEIPDGIEPGTKTTGGSLSVRQTGDQKAALLAHTDVIRQHLAAADVLNIENGESK